LASPGFQSARLDRYRAVAGQLLAAGHAYRDEGAIRFKPREGTVSFDDSVHGHIAFDTADIEHFVILRTDGYPTYHLSVVVDDADMEITHVIRGDDHISNTPKHLLLFEAMGAPLPTFAHVPLILGADKKRLSKRHGATSVTEYARQGYLPDAMVNFLALLGWSPGDDRELLSRTELIESFSLEGISGGNAVFNTEKLDWMNGQYIARLPIDELAGTVLPWLREAGLGASELLRDTAAFHRLLELLRPRAKRVSDFVEQSAPIVADTAEYTAEAIEKHLGVPDLAAHVTALAGALQTVTPFDEPNVEAAVRGTAEKQGIKAGPLIHATRVALTGRTASPGLFELIVLLGRDRSIARLHRLAAFLRGKA
jgi:glutamyl-tRNA synthetase